MLLSVYPLKASAFSWDWVFIWQTNHYIEVVRAKEPPTPKEYLKEQAGDLFELMNRIVIAESGWKPDIKNKKSSASGLFQFIDGTFRSQCIEKYEFAESMADKNDPYIQIDCALAMIKDGGLSHWNASKALWKLKN